MIIALTGGLCSGKTTLAYYILKTFPNFKIVNLLEVFAKDLGIECDQEAALQRFYSGKIYTPIQS
jgi:uridine kinase